MPDSPPRITIVVCCHNGASKLPIALDSIARQDLPDGDWELVVVDDGSRDRTASVAARPGARVVSLRENVGLAAARNAGVAAARAAIVAFTDDDCAVAPSWARELLAAFDDATVDGISGPVAPESSDRFVRDFLRAHNPLVALPDTLLESNGLAYRLALYARGLLHDAPPVDGLYSVVGANMAFRRHVLEQIGGFDPAFRFGAEEEELCRRLHARPGGATLRYAPRALVTHWFDEGVSDSLRRARAYGRGNARTARKDPSMRPIVFPAPVLVAALAAAGVLRSRPAWVAGALIAPLAGYPSWLRDVRARRSPEPLLYPYLQLAQELWTMAGEIEGWRAGYVPAG